MAMAFGEHLVGAVDYHSGAEERPLSAGLLVELIR